MRQTYCVQMLVKKGSDGVDYPFSMKPKDFILYSVGWVNAVGGLRSYRQAMEIKKNLCGFFPAETFAVEVE